MAIVGFDPKGPSYLPPCYLSPSAAIFSVQAPRSARWLNLCLYLASSGRLSVRLPRCVCVDGAVTRRRRGSLARPLTSGIRDYRSSYARILARGTRRTTRHRRERKSLASTVRLIFAGPHFSLDPPPLNMIRHTSNRPDFCQPFSR